MKFNISTLAGTVLAAVALASAAPAQITQTATSELSVVSSTGNASAAAAPPSWDADDNASILENDSDLNYDEDGLEEDDLLTNSTIAARAAKKPATKKAGTRYVVYADNWLSEQTYPTAKALGGYTHFALAFWSSAKPLDNALGWTQLSAASRKKIKKGLGKTKLLVSAFGATEQPTTQGRDAVKTARALAQFVKKYDFDGADIDYEDLDAFNSGTGKAEKWLIDFTRTLRKELGNKKIISHAPLAPWFQPGGRWRGGGYLKVHKEVGKLINFYNIQFYNQGDKVYGTCESLMTKSNSQWPKTSVMEMIASGIPGDKIVVGKPGGKADATNGFMDAKTLGKCLKKYKGKKDFAASAMVWQWAHAGAKWVQAVRAAK